MSNYSLFLKLLKKGDYDEINTLLDESYDLILRQSDAYGMTALHHACTMGHLTIVKKIYQLSQKLDETEPGTSFSVINAFDKYQRTPLFLSVLYHHFKISEYLLKETPCVVNCWERKNSDTPLHILSRLKIIEDEEILKDILNLLYENGADLNARNLLLETPLYLSCLSGSKLLTTWLLSYRMYVNYKTRNGETPLHAALKSGNSEIIKSLLDFRVNTSVISDNLDSSESSIVQLFTNYDEYRINSYNDSPLYKKKAPLSNSFANLNSPEAFNKHKRIDELGNPWGRTILHQAVILGNIQDVKWILEDKSIQIVNDKDSPKGWSVILYSSAYGYLFISSLLAKNGADVLVLDADGSSILHLLARNRITNEIYLEDLIKTLVDLKIDVNLKNTYGYTALHEAALRNNTLMIQELINNNANVNIVTNDGESPLIYAVKRGQLEATKILISNNANTEIRGKYGTALEIARSSCNLEILKCLLFAKIKKEFNNNSLLEELNDLQLEDGGISYRLNIHPLEEKTSCYSRDEIFEKLNQFILLTGNQVLKKLKEIFSTLKPPIFAYKCSCYLKGTTDKAKDGILAVWRKYMIFMPSDDSLSQIKIFYKSIVDIETRGFILKLLNDKVIINANNKKLVIEECQEMNECINMIQYLRNHRKNKSIDSIGTIHYPKESTEFYSFDECITHSEPLVLYLNCYIKNYGRKSVYVSSERVVFGKASQINILFKDITLIRLNEDKTLEIKTIKQTYVITSEKSDYLFKFLEYLWNQRQSDNRIVVFLQKGRNQEILLKYLLSELAQHEDVFLRYIIPKDVNKRFNELRKLGIDVVTDDVKSMHKHIIGMRKAIIVYFEEDPAFLEAIESILIECKKEQYFRLLTFVTFDTGKFMKQYTDSVNNVKSAIEQYDIPFLYINSSVAFMQLFLNEFINIKNEWVFKLPFEDNKIAWLDIRDLVDVIKDGVLNHSTHLRRAYHLSGPYEYTCDEVASLMTNIIKQEVRYCSITFDEMKGMLEDSLNASNNKNKEDEIKTILTNLKIIAHEQNTRICITTKDIIRKSPRTISAFIKENRDHFKDDKITKFSFLQYEALKNLFNDLSDSYSHLIDENRFIKSLGTIFTHLSVLSKRLFKVFDRNNCGKIALNDYMVTLSHILCDSKENRVNISKQLLFSGESEDYLENFLILMETIYDLFDSIDLNSSTEMIKSIINDDLIKFLRRTQIDTAMINIRKNFKNLDFLYADINNNNPNSHSDDTPICLTHPSFDFTLRILIGLSKLAIISENYEDELVKSDFSSEEIVSISTKDDVDKWTMYAVAPKVFKKIRKYHGLDERYFTSSLSFERLIINLLLGRQSYFGVISSSGRSGSFIWQSSDKKLLIKSLPAEEFHCLKRNLQRFYDHYMTFSDTLISRYYGLYKIIGAHGEISYFVIMANLFDGSLRIHEQYDLKGSTHNRSIGWKDWIPTRAMKDMDFNRRIRIGPIQKANFLMQAEIDAIFLENMNICDYSLLVGIHYIDEKDTNNIRAINDVSRFRLIEGGMMCEEYEGLDHEGKVIYFCGIIDVLTEYNLKKKGESTFKSLVHQGQISAIPPTKYRKRFLRYLCAIVD